MTHIIVPISSLPPKEQWIDRRTEMRAITGQSQRHGRVIAGHTHHVVGTLPGRWPNIGTVRRPLGDEDDVTDVDIQVDPTA